jgi:cation:H+ antiporter
MLPDVYTIFVGVTTFALLVVASWCVGEGGEILGKKYDASIVGGLVIAWLNTAPETIFFITALESDNPRFAVGAVSGSSIVVCTIALGDWLWIGARARKSGKVFIQQSVKQQCYILGASVLVPVTIMVLGFNLFSAVLGVLFYIGFLIYSLQRGEPSRPEEEKDEDIEAIIEEDDEEEESTTKGVIYLCVGGVMIFLFSNPFIQSVVATASALQVSPTLLAFFLAPIASEAPEILESISLSRKGHPQSINVAFSNLVGGTLSKTTLLCAIFCFYGVRKGFVWEAPNYTISLCLISVCAFAAAAIGFGFQHQTHRHGAALFALFVMCGLVQYFLNGNAAEEELQQIVAG